MSRLYELTWIERRRNWLRLNWVALLMVASFAVIIVGALHSADVTKANRDACERAGGVPIKTGAGVEIVCMEPSALRDQHEAVR